MVFDPIHGSNGTIRWGYWIHSIIDQSDDQNQHYFLLSILAPNLYTQCPSVVVNIDGIVPLMRRLNQVRFLENIPTASFKEISDAVAQHRKQS